MKPPSLPLSSLFSVKGELEVDDGRFLYSFEIVVIGKMAIWVEVDVCYGGFLGINEDETLNFPAQAGHWIRTRPSFNVHSVYYFRSLFHYHVYRLILLQGATLNWHWGVNYNFPSEGPFMFVTVKLATWRNYPLLFVVLVTAAGCVNYEPRPLDLGKSAESRGIRSLNDSALREFLARQHTHHAENSPWSFEQMALVAFYFSPDLAAARSAWLAEQSAERTAGERPNPSLTLTPERIANPGAGNNPWVFGLSLDFPIETAGKRDLRVELAKAKSEAVRLRLGSSIWEVRSRVRKAWLDLQEAQQRTELLAIQKDALEQIQKTLEARLASGGATSGEITTARVGLARNSSQAAEARAALGEARVRLAAAVSLSPTNFPKLDDLNLKADGSHGPDAAEARRLSLTSRPDLLAAVADLAVADAAFRLELARQYPDLHLGPGYQYDQGANKWSLGFGFEIPVFNRNQGAIAEAKAKRESAAQDALALQERITGDLDSALVAVTGAKSRLAELDVLRLSHENRLASLRAQFEAGAIEALDLLNARAEMTTDGLLVGEAQNRLRHAEADLEDVLQHPLGLDLGLRPASVPLARPSVHSAPASAEKAESESSDFHSF